MTMLVCIFFSILGFSQGHELLTSKLYEHFTNEYSPSGIQEYYAVSGSGFNQTNNQIIKPVNGGPIPSYFDWRDSGAVSDVKRQLQCNACWAFSIVGAVESHLRIYLKQKDTLSEQFLIDCVSINDGCEHASLLETYGFIVTKLGGILRDADYYRYEARKRNCRWNPPSTKSISTRPEDVENLSLGKGASNSNVYPMPVVGFRRVKPDEDEMAKALYRYGPLSAGINSASMGQYIGGIDQPTDEQCDPTKLDHTIVIVGYNEYVPKDPRKPSVKYWIIKNSWGTDWGDNGFYYLERGRNACGLASDVSLPYVST